MSDPIKVSSPDDLLTPQEVADEFGVSVSTLAKKRLSGTGPRFYRPFPKSSIVRYRRGDVYAWMTSHSFLSTSEAGAAAAA